MIRLIVLAALAALSGASGAAAQTADAPWLTATCEHGGTYGAEGPPVAGWVLRLGETYSIDLYAPPVASYAALGVLREPDDPTGWIRVNLTSPSLDLADPRAQLQVLSMQGPSVLAGDQGAALWRVRLRFAEGVEAFGPGGVGQSVFTHSSYSVSEPYGTEPYIGFFNRGDAPPALDIYRRLVREGRVVAEFHTPRQGLRGGRLFAVSEYSIAPLRAFLADAAAHFARCDAAAAD